MLNYQRESLVLYFFPQDSVSSLRSNNLLCPNCLSTFEEIQASAGQITFYFCSSEHFIESLLEDDADDDETIRGTSMIVNDSLTQTWDIAVVTPGPQTADENRVDVQSTSSEIFTGNSAISTPTTSKFSSMVQCPICFNIPLKTLKGIIIKPVNGTYLRDRSDIIHMESI